MFKEVEDEKYTAGVLVIICSPPPQVTIVLIVDRICGRKSVI
jgi:hypothetical protein